MNSTNTEILWLAIGVCGLMTLLSIFGEVLRARTDDNNPVVETFMTRVRSWWGMIILFTLALIAGKVGIIVLFAFASFAALREFLTLTNKRQADHLALALGFFVVLPLQYIFVGLGWQALYTVFIPVYAFLMLPIVSALRGNADRFLIRVAETQWALMIAVFCMSHVPALLMINVEGYPADRGILLIVFFIMVVQIGDLLDFFFGRRIGKTRIIPNLSAKTWEGMACGVVCAALSGGLLACSPRSGSAGRWRWPHLRQLSGCLAIWSLPRSNATVASKTGHT